jgi:hypothetical protein
MTFKVSGIIIYYYYYSAPDSSGGSGCSARPHLRRGGLRAK